MLHDGSEKQIVTLELNTHLTVGLVRAIIPLRRKQLVEPDTCQIHSGVAKNNHSRADETLHAHVFAQLHERRHGIGAEGLPDSSQLARRSSLLALAEGRHGERGGSQTHARHSERRTATKT